MALANGQILYIQAHSFALAFLKTSEEYCIQGDIGVKQTTMSIRVSSDTNFVG